MCELHQFALAFNLWIGGSRHAIKGDTPLVIPEFALQQNVDLVVMGTVARSGLSGMITDNTAEQILNRIECPALALKPKSFACPIRIDDNT